MHLQQGLTCHQQIVPLQGSLSREVKFPAFVYSKCSILYIAIKDLLFDTSTALMTWFYGIPTMHSLLTVQVWSATTTEFASYKGWEFT